MEFAKSHSSSWTDIISGMWRGLVPHKVEIFTWLVILEKINTRGKLARLVIIPLSESMCVLCGMHQEDVNYLFLHCPFTHQLWMWWLKLSDLEWVVPGYIRQAYEQCKPTSHGPFFKKIWHSIFFIIAWSIWKERNAGCFNQMASSTS